MSAPTKFSRTLRCPRLYCQVIGYRRDRNAPPIHSTTCSTPSSANESIMDFQVASPAVGIRQNVR